MKKLFLLSLLMLIILLSGCKSENKVDVQASPTFTSGVYTLYGVKGKIGILAQALNYHLADYGNLMPI